MIPPARTSEHPLRSFNRQLVSCRLCPRLVEFRKRIAREKRKQYREWKYWGRPVPGFGDPRAEVVLVGLAPARHGGNRTGRVFTGDKSAEFLMSGLYQTGFANQQESLAREDGLRLYNMYMTPVLKCVPPDDKPTAEELRNCYPYFNRELNLLNNMICLLALGKLAYETCLRFWRKVLPLKIRDYPFGHARFYQLPNGIHLVGCYHPSPRNVNTGRLTEPMLLDVLTAVKGLLP